LSLGFKEGNDFADSLRDRHDWKIWVMPLEHRGFGPTPPNEIGKNAPPGDVICLHVMRDGGIISLI
jgi:hypothetical protein